MSVCEIFLKINVICCRMRVNCSRTVRTVHIYKYESMMPVVRAKRGSLSTPFSDSALISRRKRNTSGLGN